MAARTPKSQGGTLTITIPYTPRKWQADVDKVQSNKLVLNVHRGGGKTTYCCFKLAMAALNTKSKSGFGCSFAYIASSVTQAKRIVWRTFKSLLHDLERHGLVSFNANDLVITFKDPNGGPDNTISLFGVENSDSIRGSHFHGVVIDEAQLLDQEVWAEVIGPATQQHVAWVLVIGTPKGPKGFFYDRWCDGNAGRGGWKSITLTKDDTNAYNKKEFEEFCLTATEAQVRQEYYCDFMAAISNRVYFNFGTSPTAFDQTGKQVGERFHIDSGIRYRGGAFYIGMDFNVGFMPAIFGQKVALPGQAPFLEIFDEVWDTDTTTDRMCEVIKNKIANEGWNGRHWVCPDAAGQSRSTKTENTDHAVLRQHGFFLLVPPSNPRIKDRVQQVNTLLLNAVGMRRLFIHPRCVKTIEALTYQQYDRNGLPDKKGGYDHTSDALGYLVHQTFPISSAPTFKRSRFRLGS